MVEFLKKKSEFVGSVFFRGNLPPGLHEFDQLEKAGIKVNPGNTPSGAAWSIEMIHPEWGKANAICPKETIVPPQSLLDLDPRLSKAEADLVATCGSSVMIRSVGSRNHVLRDRKYGLRFANALMGDDGLAVCDHLSTAFWSRDALADELDHSADLDIDALFIEHAITEEDGSTSWLHSHGLAEIGALDFDILRPSPQLNEQMYDATRAIAFNILEGMLKPGGAAIEIISPGGVVRAVDAETFDKKARPQDVALRDDPSGDHRQNRVVLCEPGGGLFRLGSGRVRPSRFLSKEIDERSLIQFTNAATELMADRAVKTYRQFARYAKEFEEFGANPLAKIGYRVDGGDNIEREHLWFEVHRFGKDAMDATLLSQPYQIAALNAGDRGKHPVEKLTDWAVFTPVGQITPRWTANVRILRENADEIRKSLQEHQLAEG